MFSHHRANTLSFDDNKIRLCGYFSNRKPPKTKRTGSFLK